MPRSVSIKSARRLLATTALPLALLVAGPVAGHAAVDTITAAVAKNDYKFSALVTEIVKSDPFRMRRGKGQ